MRSLCLVFSNLRNSLASLPELANPSPPVSLLFLWLLLSCFERVGGALFTPEKTGEPRHRVVYQVHAGKAPYNTCGEPGGVRSGTHRRESAARSAPVFESAAENSLSVLPTSHHILVDCGSFRTGPTRTTSHPLFAHVWIEAKKQILLNYRRMSPPKRWWCFFLSPCARPPPCRSGRVGS